MVGPDSIALQQAMSSCSPMSAERVERLMVEVEKGQQVAGHFPSARALDRARRVLVGTITPAEAFTEIDALFA